MLALDLFDYEKKGDHAVVIETSDGPIAIRLLSLGKHRMRIGISAPDLCPIFREHHDRERLIEAEGSEFDPDRDLAA